MFCRTILCGCLVWLTCFWASSTQCQIPVVQEILNQVNLDTLRLTVQVLSGEVGSKNGGGTDTIRSRVFSSSTHDLAAEFLESRLRSYGLSSQLQPFLDSLQRDPGINVLAEQKGASGEEIKVILCAHYDSITDSGTFVPAPGADDNASGCAAVLETARILAQYRTTHTILYAFWDNEEVSSWGSNSYAKAARARGDSILGVVNLEMLGWDGNNDSLMDIHGSNIANSAQLADTVASISKLYQLALKPVVYNPGTSSSDHGAFWRKRYTAIVYSQAYFGGDFTPHYHSVHDLLQYFNMPYFHNLAKLAAGVIAHLANIEGPADVAGQEVLPATHELHQNYPNPFNPSTTIRYALPWRTQVQLTVFNTLGQQIAVLEQGDREAGYHEVTFNASGLSSGVYFYRLMAGSFVETKKLAIVR